MAPDDNLEKRISYSENNNLKDKKIFSNVKRHFMNKLGYVGLFFGLGVVSLSGADIDLVLNKNPYVREITAEQVKASDVKTTKEAYPNMSKREITKKIRKAFESGDCEEFSEIIRTPFWAGYCSSWMLEYKKDIKLYGKKDYWASVKEILKNKEGDCEDIAFLIAGGLRNNGFPSYFLILKSTPLKYHVVFLYKSKSNNKFGIQGGSGRECTSAVFSSVDELVEDKFSGKMGHKIIEFVDDFFIYNPGNHKYTKEVLSIYSN